MIFLFLSFCRCSLLLLLPLLLLLLIRHIAVKFLLLFLPLLLSFPASPSAAPQFVSWSPDVVAALTAYNILIFLFVLST
jgi:hypothetical protein